LKFLAYFEIRDGKIRKNARKTKKKKQSQKLQNEKVKYLKK